MSGNIILIGMPGSGKSTAGVLLAKAAGMHFADTDLLIQQKTGMLLQELIDARGMNGFIKTEGEIIAEAEFSDTVIATGGSAVFSENAMRVLKSGGTTVFLDAEPAELEKRINNITTRGIAMRPGQSLKSVYDERLPLYLKYADFTVKSTSPEAVTEEIMRLLKD